MFVQNATCSKMFSNISLLESNTTITSLPFDFCLKFCEGQGIQIVQFSRNHSLQLLNDARDRSAQHHPTCCSMSVALSCLFVCLFFSETCSNLIVIKVAVHFGVCLNIPKPCMQSDICYLPTVLCEN